MKGSNTSRAGRIVPLVEAVYAPVGSLEEWMGRLADAASDLSEDGAGAVCRLVKVEPRQAYGYVIRVPDPAVVQALREHEAQTAHRVDLVLGATPGLRQFDASPEDVSDAYMLAARERFRRVGVSQMHHLTALDGDLCLSVGIFTRGYHQLEGSARGWTMAAIHLATSLRLHRQAQALFAELPCNGAVLRPDGNVVDATGLATSKRARDALREGVRRIAEARSLAGHDEERALEVWRGLIAGTWSMVDRHDHDGRRYIVAIPNPVPALRDPRSLSPREAQVAGLVAAGHADKWVGYALGLARSTVATHLQSALQKLGLPSRVALTKAFACEGSAASTKEIPGDACPPAAP